MRFKAALEQRTVNVHEAPASIWFQDRPNIIVWIYDLFAAGPIPNLQDYSIAAAAILQVMGSTARWEPSAHSRR